MSDRPHPLDQVELRFGLGGAALLAALLCARVTGLPEAVALTSLFLLTACLGATLDLRYAAGLGLASWALFTGFVSHRYGQLGLAAPDLRVLALLVGAAVAGTCGARAATVARLVPRRDGGRARHLRPTASRVHVHGRAA
jgi:hypothetical protein